MAEGEGLWLASLSLLLSILGFSVPLLSIFGFITGLYVLLKKGYSGAAKLVGGLSLVLSLVGIVILLALIGLFVGVASL